MSSNVDVEQALELLAKLEPELRAYEATVPPDRPDSPTPVDGEALDRALRALRALRAGLARLRVELGRETFIYLCWRAERARAAAAAARAAAAASRRTAQVIRGAADLPPSATEREIRDAAGRVWTVAEVAPDDPSDAASARRLVFRCGADRRQASVYPPDWRVRSDRELRELLTLGGTTSDERPQVPRAR